MTNAAFLRREGFLEFTLAMTLVVLGIIFILVVYGGEMALLYRTLMYYITPT